MPSPCLPFLAMLSLLVTRASAICDAGMMVDPCVGVSCNPRIIGGTNFWKYDESNSDEFDSAGEISALKWSQELGAWTGTAPGVFKKGNAVIFGDSSAKELVLTTKKESSRSDETCGYISTPLVVSTAELTFGFYEIRAKMAKASLMSSFWLQGASGEISILDTVPASAQNGVKVSNSYHCFEPAFGTTIKSSEVDIANLDPSDGFHTYGVERGTDGAVKFYVDGILLRTLTPNDASCLQQPMQVIFSMVVANAEGVPSEFNAYTSHIEYFRHWTHSSTPVGASTCSACADGTYMAATVHFNDACNVYGACPAGSVRNADKTIKGNCEPCKAGTFKTAGTEGRWNDLCSAHKECGTGEWTDPLATVDSVTNRVCTAHAVCDITSATPTYQSIAGTSTADTVCLALAVCGNVGTEYESVAPSPNSNRGCAAVSPECVLGNTYESSAPTNLADRVCTGVKICVQNTDSSDTTNYPGFYMASAPTRTTDAVCTALQTCDYNTKEIVAPATVDTSTYGVGTEVYNVDRTCKDRNVCVSTYENTIKDAYNTNCVTVETQTYVVEYPSTTCAILFGTHLTSNTEWEAHLTAQKGNTGFTDGDWTNVGSSGSKDVKVKGTSATYAAVMESFANSGGGGCKVIVPIFFVANNRQRARKSTSEAAVARNRRTVPTPNAPQVYAVGSKPCASNDNAKCCEAGYGSDSGTCVACVAMSVQGGVTTHPTYTATETVASANGGCTAQPVCDFTSQFYRKIDPPTTQAATNNCQEMTKCSTLGKLSEALVEGKDRTCTGVDVILCNSLQFWTNSAHANFATNEWTVQPVCATCLICQANEWWTNGDATKTVAALLPSTRRRSSSSYGQTQLLIANRVCTLRSCSANKFATNYVAVAAEGTNSEVGYVCQDHDNCQTNDRYASVQGTISNNAVCTSLSSCTANAQFQTVAPTQTSDRYCKDLTVCDGTTYQQDDAPTLTTDRSCKLIPSAPAPAPPAQSQPPPPPPPPLRSPPPPLRPSPPFVWAKPPPPALQPKPPNPPGVAIDATPASKPTKPPVVATDDTSKPTKPPAPTKAPVIDIVAQTVSAVVIPPGATSVVVVFAADFSVKDIAVGFTITLTDVDGNTFTSKVKSINADGTVEFEDAVKCDVGVVCDFTSGTTIAFSETASQKSKITVAAVFATPAPTLSAGSHNHDHDGDGVQDHAGKGSVAGGANNNGATSSGKGGTIEAKGKKGSPKKGKGKKTTYKGKTYYMDSLVLGSTKQTSRKPFYFTAAVAVCFAVVVATVVHKLSNRPIAPTESVRGGYQEIR